MIFVQGERRVLSFYFCVCWPIVFFRSSIWIICFRRINTKLRLRLRVPNTGEEPTYLKMLHRLLLKISLTPRLPFRYVRCAWRSSNRKMSWGSVHVNMPFIGSKYKVLLTIMYMHTHTHARTHTHTHGVRRRVKDTLHTTVKHKCEKNNLSAKTMNKIISSQCKCRVG